MTRRRRLVVELADVHLNTLRAWEIDLGELPDIELVLQARVETTDIRSSLPPVPLGLAP